MNAVQTTRPRGMQVVPVKMDGVGMLASGKGGLEDVLENWNESKGKRPHLMYTVTCVLYFLFMHWKCLFMLQNWTKSNGRNSYR
jgi:hypothetical protein